MQNPQFQQLVPRQEAIRNIKAAPVKFNVWILGLMFIIGAILAGVTINTYENIVRKCPNPDSGDMKRVSYGITFGIGFGMSLIAYAFLVMFLQWKPSIALAILSIFLLFVFIVNAGQIDKDCDAKKVDIMRNHTALIGIFSGILLCGILNALPSVGRLVIPRITLIFGAIALALFGSLGLVAYMKCDKQNASSAFELNIAGIVIGTVAAVGVGASFYFMPA